MKYFIKSSYLFFITSLFFCCSKDRTIDTNWGGPDPLAYTYKTRWISVERLDNDGKWETMNKRDTLLLSFNYDSDAESLSESNGVYMINGDFLESSIEKNGHFKSQDQTIAFTHQNTSGENENKEFTISISEANKGGIGDIVTFTNNDINPRISIKFKNVEFQKIK